jgi:tRNA 2-thiouridine synthesizing protein A
VIEVDARGFSCPIPVVKTKKAIKENPKEMITVLVDDTAAKENVSRLAKSEGYYVKIEEIKDGFYLRLSLSPE